MAAAIAEAIPGLVSEFISDSPYVQAPLAAASLYGYKKLYDWWKYKPAMAYGRTRRRTGRVSKMQLLRRMGAGSRLLAYGRKRGYSPYPKRRSRYRRYPKRRTAYSRGSARVPLNPGSRQPRTTKIIKSSTFATLKDFTLTTDLNLAGRAGTSQINTINDYNSPWLPGTSSGVQPYGHDQLFARYSEVSVVAVKCELLLVIEGGNSHGGTFWAKLSDDSTAENMSTHGSAWDGATNVLAEGFRHLVKSSPRYQYREVLDQTVDRAGNNPKKITMFWVPKKTHMNYARDDFMQSLGAVGTNAPPQLAYLQWGYLSNHTAAHDVAVKIKKTYYIKLGNPIQVENS